MVMSIQPDPLPELPIPSPDEGPWPTFSVSQADRQAMNNGSILPVKLGLAGKVVRSSTVKPLSSNNVGTIGVGWRSSSAPSQQPLSSPLNTYSPTPVGRHIFPTRRVVVLSLIVLTIGMVAGTWLLLPLIIVKNPPGSTPTATPTPATPTPASPSGSPIDPSAAAVITDTQTSSDIDGSTRPTHITSTFTTGQLIWVTFNIHFNGQVGTVEAKFYEDNQLIPNFTNTLKINDGNGLYGAIPPCCNQKYSTPTQGAAELYWCPQYDCSNEQLAAFVNFSVSNLMVRPNSDKILKMR